MKRVTAAMLVVLETGARKYGWAELPKITSVPVEHRRAFTQPTIQALVRRRLIKYQPARIYVTGQGRRLLKAKKEQKKSR